MSDYRLFINDERTVLLRIWPDGATEIATREDSSHTWGPPVVVREEGASASAPEREDS
jgi:hypothetical protein